ncbi:MULTISPECIES: transcriptional regulator GcvA [Pseudomonas]|uniref:transcriptional regulator GcvA n=1 Tax=Pseudomonas TaxID=286 RepID=UPI000C88B013|nr:MULTISPECIES: transcriptional regulator GcvA [Pseudomonas]PMY41201.1 transcriptional regulator [Pseudomonas sp. FW306-2-2C-D06C]PYC30711.1 transcriptional regulator GcvA [Pseudomonas chlororaphis]
MNLPSLGALRAFEATARHLSVTLAAGELNVTPGAVSLQIKELEAALGIQLFVRRPRQLILTAPGEQYFATLRTAFRLMREATMELLGRARLDVLVLSCTPSFAMQWLVPRLGGLEARLPGVDVRISASNRKVDLARDGVDLAVRHGFGRYDGLVSERLLDDELIPVCSPQLLGERIRLSVDDLADLRLLHDEHRHDWQLWLEAAGASRVDGRQGTVFVDSNGAIEAAKAGLGVALVRLSLVQRELAEGLLLAPIARSVASDLAYYLVYPATTLERPNVAVLRQWLLSEAGRGASSEVSGH